MKINKMLNTKIWEGYLGSQYTPDPAHCIIRVHHLIKWTVLGVCIWLCSGCGPAPQANGEPFKATQVWHRIISSDTSKPAIKIGAWAFNPGTIEYIMWKRMDSLEQRLQWLEGGGKWAQDSTGDHYLIIDSTYRYYPIIHHSWKK
jgi:hypothetical protein